MSLSKVYGAYLAIEVIVCIIFKQLTNPQLYSLIHLQFCGRARLCVPFIIYSVILFHRAPVKMTSVLLSFDIFRGLF